MIAALALVILFTRIRRLPSTFPLLAAAAIAGFALIVFSPRTPRLILNFLTGQQTDHNIDVRVSEFEVLPELLERRPLLGAGFSTHDPAVVIFDNGYITALVEFGIIGFAVLIGFLLVVVGRSFRLLARAPRADQPILLSGLLAVPVGEHGNLRRPVVYSVLPHCSHCHGYRRCSGGPAGSLQPPRHAITSMNVKSCL